MLIKLNNLNKKQKTSTIDTVGFQINIKIKINIRIKIRIKIKIKKVFRIENRIKQNKIKN